MGADESVAQICVANRHLAEVNSGTSWQLCVHLQIHFWKEEKC